MALDGDPVLRCNVSQVTDPDMTTVAILARLQLAARRLGCEIRLQSCPEGLRELLALAGLEDALPVDSLLCLDGVEPRRQAEQREHPLRVQEEADPGDPAL